MRIVYEQTVREIIDAAVAVAQHNARPIDYIELTEGEWLELRSSGAYDWYFSMTGFPPPSVGVTTVPTVNGDRVVLRLKDA